MENVTPQKHNIFLGTKPLRVIHIVQENIHVLESEFKWQCSRVNICNVKLRSRVNIGFSRDNAELAAVGENDKLESFRMRDSNRMN